MRKTWDCTMCGGQHFIGESHLQALSREARSAKPRVLQPEPQWSPYPIAKPAERPVSPSTATGGLKVIRILLVEDDAAVATVVERVLRRIGDADVAVTTTGEAAAALLAGGDFDLVVSDFDLAGKATGADVLKAAASHVVPFMFHAGNDDVATFGVPYVMKPARPSELRDIAVRLLDPAKLVPSAADRLAVGETLRALAAAGKPGAEAMARVGSWLASGARAELGMAKKGNAA